MTKHTDIPKGRTRKPADGRAALPAKPSWEKRAREAEKQLKALAKPDEPDPDEMKQWLDRWGGSPIEYGDDNRWTIFGEGLTPFPDQQTQADTAWYSLHVMHANAIACTGQTGKFDHWRRFDPATGTWHEIDEDTIMALVRAVAGKVTDSYVNSAYKLMCKCVLGAPSVFDGEPLGMPDVVPTADLDSDPRYRACLAQNGEPAVVDILENRVVTNPDEIAALGLWFTRPYPPGVRIVPNCDLGGDINGENFDRHKEKLDFTDTGYEPNEDPDDEWTDQEYTWAQAGFSGWEKPSRRIMLFVGPSGGGKSTKLTMLLSAEGDHATQGYVADLSNKDSETRFTPKEAWCWKPIVGYDDAPDSRWKWSIILPASSGSVIPCETKYGKKKRERLRGITTAWVATNPRRLAWVGVNTEGGEERAKIVNIVARPRQARDPQDKLAEWEHLSVQGMAENDIELQEAVAAKRIRYQSMWLTPPPDTANVERNTLQAQEAAVPPLDAWLSDLFVYGDDLELRSWKEVLRRGADEHPEGSLEPWLLETDLNNKEWLVVPQKGYGTERIDIANLASRARDIHKHTFKQHGVKVKKFNVKGKTVSGLAGVGMREPRIPGDDGSDPVPDPAWEEACRTDAAATANWQEDQAEKRRQAAAKHRRYLDDYADRRRRKDIDG